MKNGKQALLRPLRFKSNPRNAYAQIRLRHMPLYADLKFLFLELKRHDAKAAQVELLNACAELTQKLNQDGEDGGDDGDINDRPATPLLGDHRCSSA